jgi:hypothetical protein
MLSLNDRALHPRSETKRFIDKIAVSDSVRNSTWSWRAEPVRTSAKIVQYLSPTSSVTQSTEITVLPRDTIKESEQRSTMVHISASGMGRKLDSAGRRYAFPFILHLDRLFPTTLHSAEIPLG